MESYNDFLLSNDTDRLRKIFVREEIFRRTLKVPGDIVECGVFKGTGLLTWLKLRHIFIPNSIKRVVGFDTFESIPKIDNKQDKELMEKLYSGSNFQGITTKELYDKVNDCKFTTDTHVTCELVQGQIEETAKKYIMDNPGFRISLLHMDLDVKNATYEALKYLYPRVTVGGIILFDEYAIKYWSESEGVDKYFEEIGVKLKLQTIEWGRTPSAYFIKE